MSSIDGILEELRSVLAKLESIDFWPPWDAARTIVEQVRRAVDIMTEEPAPDPTDIDDAVAAWKTIGERVGVAHTDLGKVPGAVPTTVWEGAAGDDFRTSVGNLKTRVDTVDDAARGVKTALKTLSASMTKARKRHNEADDELRKHLSISWGMITPSGLVDKLTGIVRAAVHAVQEAIGAYEDAADAHRLVRRQVRQAMDGITLPDHLPKSGGVSVVDAVNEWKDDSGPLRGSVLERYDEQYAGLSAADQKAVTDALAGAGSDLERGWIMAGVASGLTGQALANYLARLRLMDKNGQLGDLDPTGHRGSEVEQPDGTTCGSSSLVMSRMMNDPAYAMWMATGYDPATGVTDPRTMEERFADEAKKMHDRTNSWQDRDGDWQLWWPEGAGTTPAAVANEMSSEGGSGIPGTNYESTLVDPNDRGAAYDRITSAVEDGHTVPIFVGNEVYPGHVVLVTGTSGDSVTLYDPASGTDKTISRDEFESGNLPFGPASGAESLGDMDEPWAIVVPER